MSSPGVARRDASASPPEAARPNRRFPRSSRLTARRQFRTVYENGRRVASRSFVLFGLPNEGAGSRLGVTVTKKFGGAVERNRAKRIVRELFRRNRAELLPALDLVVNVRAAVRDTPIESLEREFLRRFRELARGLES